MPNPPLRKLAAIMFTDMVGYSALMQRNEALGMELLEEHRQMVRPILTQHGGQEIKTIGDAFLVEFASSVQAVQCAVEIQRMLTQHNFTAPIEKQFQVRIGVHVGDVIYQENDVLGDGVNIASRIQPQAEPGGIALSGDVARQVQNKTDLKVEKVGLRQLKNIQEPVEIFRVVLPWDKGQLPTAAPVVARPSGKRIIPIVVAGIGITIVLAGLGWWRSKSRPSAPQPAPVMGPIQSLAVLPLENLMGDPQQEYFVDGMTEALIANLGQIEALRVISRTSVMQYKGTKKSMPEIARELNVDGIIEGSVLRSGDQVRITAQLIHAPTDKHLWAKSYERDLRDVLALQSEVAQAIATEIKIKVTPQEQTRLARARPVNPEAYQLYLKGRYFTSKWTVEGMRKGVEYLNQAIEGDPRSAQTYVGLAYYYCVANEWLLPPNEAMIKSRKAAKKSLEMDDSLAEAHTYMAVVHFWYDWDFAAAEKEFKRAIEVNPSDAVAHGWYGWYLASMGRFDEAIAENKRALELDPLSPERSLGLGWDFYNARQFDQATQELRKTIELDSNYWATYLFLGRTYEQMGRLSEALAAIQKARLIDADNAELLAALGHAHALSGNKREAERILNRLREDSKRRYISPYYIASVYVGLGDKNRAFEWLEKAYQERSLNMAYLRVEPQLDGLRSDPRFQDLLRRMNFPP